MTKIQVEVCLVSARGLRRSSSFWKLQWFAVGWIKPDQKYCSKIDSSGSSNPSWRTKFAVTIDASDTSLQDLCLTVEVHSREPLFLREKLYGTAIIQLKEFFLQFANNSEGLSSGIEEVGSFQLRKKRSEKPLGFVDVSIRISEFNTAISSNTGILEEGAYRLPDGKIGFPVNIPNGPAASYYPSHPYPRPNNDQAMNYPPTMAPSNHPMAPPPNYSTMPAPHRPPSNYSTMPAPHRPPTPPPPPPPSHVGFMPTFLPATGPLPHSYINMPPSAAGGRGSGSGLGMGLGAGALAAGAVIFGDDFMSGFDYPSGFNGGSLTVSTNPPF